MVTPMECDSSIDYIGLLNLFRFNLVYNTTHFLINATTSESLSLSILEKIFIIRFLRFYFADTITLYCGSCFCSTSDSLAFLSILNTEYIDFVLQITPYYFISSSKGIVWHFTVLSLLSVHPIILYNVPKRTALDISSECLALILQLSNVCGLKDSSGSYLLNFERVNLCYLANKRFFCGDDTQYLKLRTCGIQGLVSVFSSCFPYEFRNLQTEVQVCHLYIFKAIVCVCAKVLNPILVKWFLGMFLYYCCCYRLPLVALGCLQYYAIILDIYFYCKYIFLYRRLECSYYFNEFN
ncbi:dihydrodipicolinate synthase family protein [Candidatus Vidania fulgoroideae]|nr:dihydrodipicolinate synthase family protein [Candidatus Vidania fulgoroideae]